VEVSSFEIVFSSVIQVVVVISCFKTFSSMILSKSISSKLLELLSFTFKSSLTEISSDIFFHVFSVLSF